MASSPAIQEQTAHLLYPLSDFYAREGVALPRADAIDGAEIPEPYRTLLVHANDMTPTLERYTGKTLHIELFGFRREVGTIYRQVRLVPDGGTAPVEFGAIRIELAPLPVPARELIDGCRVPLGTILHRFSVPHMSRPSAYFRVKPDTVIREALRLNVGPILYGRHNVITTPDGEPLADVVEILPPMEKRETQI